MGAKQQLQRRPSGLPCPFDVTSLAAPGQLADGILGLPVAEGDAAGGHGPEGALVLLVGTVELCHPASEALHLDAQRLQRRDDALERGPRLGHLRDHSLLITLAGAP